ncbi:MAG: thioredoxin family protein [Anaerovoracaceae bacterium]|jgi:thioredoxin 1
MSIKFVDSGGFRKEIESSDDKRLVFFYNERRMPCMIMRPVLDEVAEENKDVDICCIDITKNGELARYLEVMAVPTFFMFRGSRRTGKKIGTCSKSQIQKFIDM